MTGLKKSRRILEFDKIIQKLADCAPTEGAAEKILQIEPQTDINIINRLLDETTVAKKMTVTKGNPPFGRVKNILDSIDRAKKSATLSTRELLDIASVLRVIASLIKYQGDKITETVLSVYFDNLTPNSFLENEISRCIIAEDMISDNASDNLYIIRKNIKRTENNIRDLLAKYTTGQQSKFLQENIVTVRNGRYVIPVKSEYRNEIKGLLHDTSASGATLFIEPIAVLEANNALHEYKSAEIDEIEKILYDLSEKVSQFSKSILVSYDAITELAIIFARAELSYKLVCERPSITETRNEYRLIKARHPLLNKDTVVPITIEMNKNIKTLVITGPNTGGKTVTLKTIGLLSMMAQTGLHIPCSEETVLPLFDAILPDIGDEQSIEQSLSTFSSHISNIVDIISNAKSNSLVLFDELGAGTDPGEGAALAIAILEKIISVNAFCAATTHYAELKIFALETEGVLNASCEFDVNTLRPTYRLITGLPGKSNAFAIAERLGINSSIIEHAKKISKDENLHFEDVLAKLEESEFNLRLEREKAEKSRITAEILVKKAESESKQIIDKANKEIERAKAQASQLILGAKALSESVLNSLEELKKQKEKENFAALLDETRKNISSSIKNISDKSNITVIDEDENYILPRGLKIGDKVSILNMGGTGTIITIDNKTVSVKIGNSTIKISADKLKLINNVKTTKKSKSYVKTPFRNFDLKREINLRGQTVDDAWFMIDNYLDSAIYEGFESVTLIHGKGTGALRNGLWQLLKGDSRIKSYRSGTYGEGDLGVTIVELK
ncbi:MAG: hypothetical protein A2Y17_12485 [Clostridiales bacterium GWF2_38_85]|nr:MAG: hypothetical protein A2Y17_12485 [Clostridiales bacterium GWF2_38_85]HBL84075.1 endonuclease MutS2 [Clostridiales bacterium]